MPLKYRALDNAVVPIFERMKSVGMRLDQGRVTGLLSELDAALQASQSECIRLARDPNFNPASGDQVAEWCRQEWLRSGKCGLVRRTKSQMRDSTDERALAQIRYDHPLIEAILDYREVQKMQSFVRPLVGLDRLHPNWRLTTVKSGRVATTEPNIMAYPAPGRTGWGTKIRACFVADPGWVWLGFDYSQIEVRLAAHLTGDIRLRDIYRTGRDIYVETARGLFRVAEVDKVRHRLPAKTVTLGTLYGIQGQRLWEQLILGGCVDSQGIPYYTLERMVREENGVLVDEYGRTNPVTCEALLRDWMRLYEGVPVYIRSVAETARANGATVYTHLSRRPRFLPALWLKGATWPNGKLRAEAERQAFNHEVQGTAADVMKAAQVRVWKQRSPEWEPLLQYHDELVVAVRQGAEDTWSALFREALVADSEWCAVPLTVEEHRGETWSELK